MPPHPLEEPLGYTFENPLLLAEALTHPSLAYETHRSHFDNQRLEFLGDAVLQLIFTHELFRTFVEFNEGNLTKLRARLVSRAALAGYARKLGVGPCLLMGRGEESCGGRDRSSTLSDAFEAIIGAVYLDGGFSAARGTVLRLCAEELQRVCQEPREVNPKGQLQEILQSRAACSPHYTIVSSEGPDHKKTFVARVEWAGTVLAHGTGLSKKQAETAAAEAALHSSHIELLLDGGAVTPAAGEPDDSAGESIPVTTGASPAGSDGDRTSSS